MIITASENVQPTAATAEAAGAESEILGQLRSWADAIGRVRAMRLGVQPLDPDRYWHYFACTD